MIYSRWRPDRGGYEYFEASRERRGLGDDLPVPRLTGGTAIGVPSTEAGRSPGGTPRRAGTGKIAKGLVMPMSRAGLAGMRFSLQTNLQWPMALALGIGIGWLLRGRK